MIFFGIFIADLFYTVFIEIKRDFKIVQGLKTASLIFLVYFFAYSFICGVKGGFQWYFKSVWNYIDILLIIIYIPLSILDLDKDPEDYITVRILFCPMVTLVFIKMTYYLRILEGFSF